ncbi:cyclophilin-like fold protein [Agathobaculum sp. Marseille-P7918]|uniref:cyclophilin-like fold protein n=1 Tax=Agathobaculum sp. Marseille-P7918 TaxID=2479843 RepID=UPI003563C7C1
MCITILTACSASTTPASDTENDSSASETIGTSDGDSAADGTQAEDSLADYDPTITGAYEDGSTPQFSGEKLRLAIDGEEVVIAMYDNTAVDALMERLPLEELSFFDLSGIEKPIERLEEPLSLGEEEPGYDPVTGEMVIYRPWANFTIFYGDFRYSSELVPLGKVESGLEVLSSKTEDFAGTLERMEDVS